MALIFTAKMPEIDGKKVLPKLHSFDKHGDVEYERENVLLELGTENT